MAGSDLFQEQDLELLAALALPIGVAIENHRLLAGTGHLDGRPQDPAGALAPSSAADPGLPVLGMLPPRSGGGGRPLRLHRGRAPDHVGPGQPQPWAVALGDVAGKGMPAALISASIRPEIRVLARSGVGPGEVLSRVNRQVFDQEIDGRFVTLLFCLIDPRTHELTVANAGHPLALIRHAGGSGRGDRPALGAGASAGGGTAMRTTSPALLSFSPAIRSSSTPTGCVDALDKQKGPLGLERLPPRAGRSPPRSRLRWRNGILAAVRNHYAGRLHQFDDITLVCFGRNGE